MVNQQPNLDEWRDLYAAADEFRKAAPWQWMYDSDLFGVQNPETGLVGYCSIMGNLGEHYALGLYEGPEGLASYLRLRQGAGPANMETIELFHRQLGLMASFEDREFLEPEDRAIIKQLGLKYRGRHAWPLFRRMRPYRLAASVDSADARFLAAALRQAVEVGLRCKKDPEFIEQAGEPKFLVRVQKDTESGTIWMNERQPVPEFETSAPVPPYVPNDLDMARLERLPKHPSLACEADFVMMPTPVASEEGGHFPFIMLLVEPNSGAVMGVQIAEPWGYHGKFGQALLKAIETLKHRPAEIRVGREELFELFSGVTDRLDITLRLSDELPTLDEVLGALMEQMQG